MFFVDYSMRQIDDIVFVLWARAADICFMPHITAQVVLMAASSAVEEILAAAVPQGTGNTEETS
jgi:hypothetical protein